MAYWARDVLVMDPEDAAKVGAAWTGADVLAGGSDLDRVGAVAALSLSPQAALKLAAARTISNWEEDSRTW